METVITAMSDVFELAGTCVTQITSQPILLFCLAASLVPVGISIFGRLKSVAPVLVLCGGCLLRFMVVNTDDRADIPGEIRYYNRVAKPDAEFVKKWEYGKNLF